MAAAVELKNMQSVKMAQMMLKAGNEKLQETSQKLETIGTKLCSCLPRDWGTWFVSSGTLNHTTTTTTGTSVWNCRSTPGVCVCVHMWNFEIFLVFNCILLHRSDFPTLSLCLSDVNFSELSGVNRVIVPFLACGDLSAYDSDMTYPLEVHVCLHCISLYWIVQNVVILSEGVHVLDSNLRTLRTGMTISLADIIPLEGKESKVSLLLVLARSDLVKTKHAAALG